MLSISNDTFGKRYINYALNPDMKNLNPLQTLDKFIAYCNIVNMKVIIDRHACRRNGYYTENRWYIPKIYPEERVIADFQMLALRYISLPAFIGFDLWNEPKATSPWSEWSKGASRLGNAILEINPKLLIIVEGNGVNFWWGGNLEGAAKFPVILSHPQQLVYSPHEYGPSVFNQTW
jgi:aryl-phospho-beta-D-glucosidase BglC (GH1 family)